MSNRKFSLINNMIIGIGIGIPVTLVCMTMLGGFNEIIKEFLIWTVASALFGVISGLVFDSKSNLNLPVSLLIHCGCCLLVATAAGAICGYSDSFISLLLSILPVFIVVYVLVFALVTAKMKIEEKQINKTLSEK